MYILREFQGCYVSFSAGDVKWVFTQCGSGGHLDHVIRNAFPQPITLRGFNEACLKMIMDGHDLSYKYPKLSHFKHFLYKY